MDFRFAAALGHPPGMPRTAGRHKRAAPDGVVVGGGDAATPARSESVNGSTL